MATNEYNREQTTGLDEPRRTAQSSEFDRSEGGGYGGVSESEPPHHKIHSEDEPLPKPRGGANYDEEQFSRPSETGAGGTFDEDSTEKFQDSSSEVPQTGSYDETPETRDRGFGGREKTSGGYADPSEAFPGAPVDRTLQEPGYGHAAEAPEPLPSQLPSTGTEPESPTPKKEGFVQKLMDKLPGHHKTGTPETAEGETLSGSPTDAGTPKKGFVAKIKEKLPGHSSPTAPTTGDY